MDSITLQNYRCFGSAEQTARLAPLTLLVGPNSTGKTSFLALIRALWDVAFREVVPNFREEPYDLGSFDDIVHQPGGRTKPAKSFTIGFKYRPTISHEESIGFTAAFENRQTAPFPVMLRIVSSDATVEIAEGEPRKTGISAPHSTRPLASAPTRSRPRRTYDPMTLAPDSEGDYVPSYLANLYRRNADEWQLLKSRLEEFGRTSELFDEISVRSFGKSDGDPFQLQVRKFGNRRKGPWRNLIDVSYGVSQALPVLTELLRGRVLAMFLLQQPELHLHPQVQAALGTLFCSVAAKGRQLVIETDSDYIIDRVRMDVRDQTTGLRPEDVSILYFEPGDLEVKIHSITIDGYGNLDGAPPGYRQFFADELTRSIGL